MFMIVIGLSIVILVLLRVVVVQKLEISSLKDELAKWKPAPKVNDNEDYW